MTLYELSMEYRTQAELLRGRIRQLRELEAGTQSEFERLRIHDRVRVLSSMWRDTREVAHLMEHYYERSCRRNARYIL